MLSRSSDDKRADSTPLSAAESSAIFTPHDVKRLESYARNLVDYHMILDLLPDLSRLYFSQRLQGVALPRLQAGIVMGLGLQRSSVDALAAHFDIAVTQVLALFNKAVRKLSTAITGIHEQAIEAELDNDTRASSNATTGAPTPVPRGKASKPSVAPSHPAHDDGDDDEDAAPRAAAASALLAAEPELRRYAVPDDPWAWAAALNTGKVTAADPPRVVTVRHSAQTGGSDSAAAGSGQKRRADQSGGAVVQGGDAEVYDPRNRLGDGSGKKQPKKSRS